MRRRIFFDLIALGIFALGIFFFIHYSQPIPSVPAQNQLSSASVSQIAPPAIQIASSTYVATSTPRQPTPAKKPSVQAISPTSSTPANEVARIQNPYTTPAESFDEINTDARAALVNILCQPQGGSLQPISGSGVIIDSRGVILTNAHVAQYVLLSESPQVDLTCSIRTGSPARAQWKAVVLYIPPVWVNQHASEILDQHPTGTGEHDYALLFITGSVDGSPLPAQFPYVTVDTRPAIAFPGDQVLVASYPAEFIGGIAAEYALYANSSVTTVKQLLTFVSDTPDLLSLGGVIEAQSGSSGGAVLNAWGRLVGLIATTSGGATTADRDLRAIAISYINTDLEAQSGQSLNTFLSGDPASEAQGFSNTTAPSLISLYISRLYSNQVQ